MADLVQNRQKFQNSIFQRIFNQCSPDLSALVLSSSNHVAEIVLQCLDLAKPVTKNFGPISSLTWRSRSRSPKSRSTRWRHMWVHSCEVSSKSDYKLQSYMDLKFRVFGTKMGLWPWKVGQGRWKWVSVFRLTRVHTCTVFIFVR